jgi:hypothetical protein
MSSFKCDFQIPLSDHLLSMSKRFLHPAQTSIHYLYLLYTVLDPLESQVCTVVQLFYICAAALAWCLLPELQRPEYHRKDAQVWCRHKLFAHGPNPRVAGRGVFFIELWISSELGVNRQWAQQFPRRMNASIVPTNSEFVGALRIETEIRIGNFDVDFSVLFAKRNDPAQRHACI